VNTNVSFCTAINCIDGRAQLPIIRYLQDRFSVLYVDVVTEAGPVRALADPADSEIKASILSRVRISFEKHGSRVIAIAAHADCAGNPVSDERQLRELAVSADRVAEWFPEATVLGLWVTTDGLVVENCIRGGG